ncbi:MAG: DUF2306 domain-containing protein [Anaerolineales bacterium]|nr:DUF2306 domain-containing protein [Anaerolineales bacterium]
MKTNQISKNIGWGVMTFLALGITLVASRYFTWDTEVFFPAQLNVYLAHRVGIITHIVGGVLALSLGPFQFLSKLRNKYPIIHRWMGRLYLVGILLGGTAGLYMSMFAYSGIVASVGFASLAILWLATGVMAYRTIRARDTEAHRRWMIRNFALTFAAVTLRLEMAPLSMLFGEETGYAFTAWTCWTINLLVAEGMIRGWFRRGGARAKVQKASRLSISNS